MTATQKEKIDFIKKELETIAADCGGVLTEFTTEDMKSDSSIAVNFTVSHADGNYYDFTSRKYICLTDVVFIGVRGGMHYVYFPKKTDNCHLRYAKNIHDMLNQTKKVVCEVFT